MSRTIAESFPLSHIEFSLIACILWCKSPLKLVDTPCAREFSMCAVCVCSFGKMIALIHVLTGGLIDTWQINSKQTVQTLWLSVHIKLFHVHPVFLSISDKVTRLSPKVSLWKLKQQKARWKIHDQDEFFNVVSTRRHENRKRMFIINFIWKSLNLHRGKNYPCTTADTWVTKNLLIININSK